MHKTWILDQGETVLVTGAAGFVGSRVVDSLLRYGFKNIRCFVRPGSDHTLLKAVLQVHPENCCQVITGNLLSKQDCIEASDGVSIVYHLVAGRGKSFPSCFQDSVVTTRNLLDAVVKHQSIRRFVNVSSFSVYSNFRLRRGAIWDETCSVEDDLEKRYDAYAYGKIKQEEIVLAYHKKHGLPFTNIRPGIVIGTGKKAIPGFVGIDTFGVFIRIGGSQRLPLTYVENCADAIALAGLVPAIEGEVFNVVDDDLPNSRKFLREYKRKVRRFRSIWIPYPLAYLFCYLWEHYSVWSDGQLPAVFNRRMCSFAWKGNRYSNRKIKERLGWQPRVPMQEALEKYYEYQKNG